jgi:hypothetical protein
MLLAESLPQIVVLLLLDHLRRLVGMMDLEDPFEFRHPLLSPFGPAEKLQPPKHSLPKPAGNLKDGPSIVRNLIIKVRSLGEHFPWSMSSFPFIPLTAAVHLEIPSQCSGGQRRNIAAREAWIGSPSGVSLI